MGDEDIDKWLTELLDKLSDQKFLDFLDEFTTKHCDQFEEGEFSLSCTDIHNQYKRLFESRMESYLRKQSVTMDRFAELLQERIQKDPSYAEFLQVLINVDDLQSFSTMMIQKRAELEDEEDEEDEEEEGVDDMKEG
mmetsp:Transcript_34837/g.58525  ORF Transcript_34837/g.58525 Transcript_34837/m.58525 type:complete len:137 (+) Transcript_34837:169-579(+)|eukprot:CAMPEP_0198202860 /NCGR_PEP_ID=MMETSP1445-20131203/6084_1 /TAXON_ID=36898 /ORGANISM="Pyramimonas sp., Strain CCMP2087" /LENGTH=136 /DNA_ID=CAMNT_0043873981 /DNA_START=195 /DNA_END=605 /DNA_ORIENTATION=-